jgi:hypothetical protein
MKSIIVCALCAVSIGCFSPKYRDGDLQCGAGNACPPGFHCGGDHRCYHNGINPDLGHAPTLDMTSGPDGGAIITQAPPAPIWTAACGGSGMSPSADQLSVSIAGSVVGGAAVAPSGAIITFGYFATTTY